MIARICEAQSDVKKDIVMHGFRHAMRDRLRAVSCPSEMIDQIGGWSSGKIGEGYGNGFDLRSLVNRLEQI